MAPLDVQSTHNLREAEPVRLGDKFVIAVVASAINAVLYMVPNHVQLSEPHLLPWTRVDAAVPFLPLTFWIYFSDYLLVVGAFLLQRTRSEVRQFARAYFTLLVVGSTIHLLWPTTFPRDTFPLSGEHPFTEFAFSLLRQVDLPTSCLPSMHVAGSYLAAFSLWRRSRAIFTGFTSWATAVAVSTLTAKQHYAVDVLAGLALAGIIWLLFFGWALRHHRSDLGTTSTAR